MTLEWSIILRMIYNTYYRLWETNILSKLTCKGNIFVVKCQPIRHRCHDLPRSLHCLHDPRCSILSSRNCLGQLSRSKTKGMMTMLKCRLHYFTTIRWPYPEGWFSASSTGCRGWEMAWAWWRRWGPALMTSITWPGGTTWGGWEERRQWSAPWTMCGLGTGPGTSTVIFTSSSSTARLTSTHLTSESLSLLWRQQQEIFYTLQASWDGSDSSSPIKVQEFDC